MWLLSESVSPIAEVCRDSNDWPESSKFWSSSSSWKAEFLPPLQSGWVLGLPSVCDTELVCPSSLPLTGTWKLLRFSNEQRGVNKSETENKTKNEEEGILYSLALEKLSSKNEHELAPEPGLLPSDTVPGRSLCLVSRLLGEFWKANQRWASQSP